MKVSPEDLGKVFVTKDKRMGIFLGCMESDDEYALEDKDGKIFFVWSDQIREIIDPDEIG